MEQEQELNTNINPKESFDDMVETKTEYDWILTTKCVTHDAKAMKEWQQQQQKYQGMGLEKEVERPQKQSKFYQFHIKEVESVVEYEDEDFGDITVINKYNGTQVPIIEDFMTVAELHRAYNNHRDDLLEDSFREVKEEL